MSGGTLDGAGAANVTESLAKRHATSGLSSNLAVQATVAAMGASRKATGMGEAQAERENYETARRELIADELVPESFATRYQDTYAVGLKRGDSTLPSVRLFAFPSSIEEAIELKGQFENAGIFGGAYDRGTGTATVFRQASPSVDV